MTDGESVSVGWGRAPRRHGRRRDAQSVLCSRRRDIPHPLSVRRSRSQTTRQQSVNARQTCETTTIPVKLVTDFYIEE